MQLVFAVFGSIILVWYSTVHASIEDKTIIHEKDLGDLFEEKGFQGFTTMEFRVLYGFLSCRG